MPRTGARGFTLVELLVAVAIITSVLAGVTALFVGSLQTVQRGQLALGGHELARTTLNTVERDLKSAFTSRDWGDYYTFHGTPIGFSYVGVTGARGGVGAGEDNLSRVTYAISLGHVTVDEVFAPSEENIFGRPAGLGRAFFFDDDEELVFTYTLVRYVEPAFGDLDNFIVTTPEGERVPLTQLGPEHVPAVGEVGIDQDYAVQIDNLRDELQEARLVAENLRRQPDPRVPGRMVELSGAEVQEVVDAKKRELWVRMISGDPRLPRFWANPRDFTDPRPRLRDYAIAESIVVDHDLEMAPPPVLPFPGVPFFRYGRLGHRGNVVLGNYWNAVENIEDAADDTLVIADAPGSPLRPRIPEVISVRLPFILESPHTGAADFRRVFDTTVRVPTGHTRRSMGALAGG